MKLNAILEKTNEKIGASETARKQVLVAQTDRPYEYDYLPNTKNPQNLEKISEKAYETYTTEEKFSILQPQTIQTQNLILIQEKGKSCDVSNLVGLQILLLNFIYQECKKARAKITNLLTLDYISININAKNNVIKTTIRRLEEKGFLVRDEFKNGRGGCTKYSLPDGVYNQLLYVESQQKLSAKTEKQQKNSDIETTTEVSEKSLPKEWQEIDIEPLECIKFTKNHLYQLYSLNNTTPEVIQDSINAFAFDINKNNKSDFKAGPLNYFVGILRKGMPYLAPSNYESEKDIAMKQYLKEKQESLKLRSEIEAKAQKFALDEWLVGVTDEDIKNICPPRYATNINEKICRSLMETHFIEKIWPKIKSQNIHTR